MKRAALPALLLLLFATACGHMSRQELLFVQSGAFHNDLRWKRLGEAGVRVVPWKKAEFFDAYRDRLETLQIEDYELEAIAFPGAGEPGYAEEPTMATLHMKRYQVEAPSVTRDKVKIDERWLYNGDAWFIYGGWEPVAEGE